MAEKPTRIYAVNPDPKALEQFESAMKEERAVRGALMADAHMGYSLPIGGVVGVEGAVYPAWVGYDIGCGMCAIKTTLESNDLVNKENKIFNEIFRRIPVGFDHHNNEGYRGIELEDFIVTKAAKDIWNLFKGYSQVGTLGGGNHFIEIGYGADNNVWIVIHSGSRGVGWNIAKHYMCIAAKSDRPKEGHYPLLQGTEEYNTYICDMGFCLEVALINRKWMLNTVGNILQEVTGKKDVLIEDSLINRNHNHATLKDGMWIHRKGATHAEEGMMGVIPGNMKDGSYIVRGKGNPESLWSSSHGAGRLLGRKQAKRTLNMEEFKESMATITAVVTEKTLDESPKAYKNIDEVIALQKDLIDVVDKITPMINIKG